MHQYAVVLFFSSNYSIWASKVLKKEGYTIKMMPVPRSLSSDCGYCVRINREDAKAVEVILKDKDIEFDTIIEI